MLRVVRHLMLTVQENARRAAAVCDVSSPPAAVESSSSEGARAESSEQALVPVAQDAPVAPGWRRERERTSPLGHSRMTPSGDPVSVCLSWEGQMAFGRGERG